MALFCANYPGLWCNAGWPTRDHIVPWTVYAVLLDQLPAVQALQQFAAGRGVETGLGLAFPKDDLARRRLIDEILDQALGPEPPTQRPTYF